MNINHILQDIIAHDYYPLKIGGYVRDYILGLDSKDIDIEVYGCTYQELTNILRRYGKVDLVGQSFGVIKLTTDEGIQCDFSIPRKDSKNGVGHKGFDVDLYSDLTPEEAANRRDFTINSIGMDIDNNIIDPYNGQQDLENKILRHTSERFADDPLRVLRGMQFVGRFDMTVNPETRRLCSELIGEYNSLPKERVWTEWEKWAAKSIKPSAGLNFLVETDWIKLYPEINNLINCPQDPQWHPEGDVFFHTSFVCDSMAKICKREKIGGEDKLVLMFAALCHDMGKPETTERIDGRWTARGHDRAGVKHAFGFLQSIGAPNYLIEKVKILTDKHMWSCSFNDNYPTDKSIRKLLVKLRGIPVEYLAYLIEADKSGRPPKPKTKCPVMEYVVEKAKDFDISPILKGQHLIEIGLNPSPDFTKLLDKVFLYQLEGKVSNVEDGKNAAQRLIRSGFLLV